MKRAYLLIIVFIITIFTFGTITIANPDKPKVSEIEKRTLKSMPEFSYNALFKGDFFKDCDEYFSDIFAYRDFFVSISRLLSSYKGFAANDNALIFLNPSEKTPSEEIIRDNPVDDSVQEYNQNLGINDEKVQDSVNNQELQAPTQNNDADNNMESQDESNDNFDIENNPEQNKDNDNFDIENNPEQNKDNEDENSNSSDNENDDSTNKEEDYPQNANDANDSFSDFNGSILILNNTAMEIHCYIKNICDSYINSLNYFAEKLNDDVKVYSLITPTGIEFIENEKYKALSDPEIDTINYVYENLSPKIKTINAYDILKSHYDEYIFFRTDHHWTAKGAYYAYTAFMESTYRKYVPLTEYETGKVEGFSGTYYSFTQNMRLKENPDTVYYYLPYIENSGLMYYKDSYFSFDVIDMSKSSWKNKYLIFIGGDHPMAKITTNTKNGRKIAVIKDSYGNAFVPFLIPHYEEIYIIHPELFISSFEGMEDKNPYRIISDNNINEVLFLNYVIITQGSKPAKYIRALADWP